MLTKPLALEITGEKRTDFGIKTVRGLLQAHVCRATPDYGDSFFVYHSGTPTYVLRGPLVNDALYNQTSACLCVRKISLLFSANFTSSVFFGRCFRPGTQLFTQ